MKIAVGRVSVFIAMAPASVIVAPNSPMAFAHERMPAATMPRAASGRVTVAKARAGEAPSDRATAS